MGYDSDLFMDIEFEVMDQDQSRIELWIVIFRVYKGIIVFYLLAKKHFSATFLPVFFLSLQFNFWQDLWAIFMWVGNGKVERVLCEAQVGEGFVGIVSLAGKGCY